MQQLFYSVSPDPLESVRSYILRGAAANRISPSIISKEVFGSVGSFPLRNAASLAVKFRSGALDVASLDGYWRAGRSRHGELRLNGAWMDRQVIMPRPRCSVCPTCLGEAAILRYEWELSLVSACHRHGVELIDICPSCRRPTGASKRSITSCVCGMDFRRINPSIAPVASRTVATLIASSAQNLNVPVLDRMSAATLSLLRADPAACIRTIKFLALVPLDPLEDLRRRQGLTHFGVRQSVGFSERVEALLNSWPDGFLVQLERAASTRAATSKLEAARLLRVVRDAARAATEVSDPLGLLQLFQYGARRVTRMLGLDGAVRGYAKQLELDLD